MTSRKFGSAVAVVAVALMGAACESTPTSESPAEYVDSSVISTKVRSKIAADDKISIFDIDVNTFKDVVQLSGFVDNSTQKARAGQVAASVDGVRYVRNNITVKSR